MRQITVKYDGECANCGKEVTQGEQAMYEKSMGIFCIGCEPTETEDIRSFRQVKANRKADKYEKWAAKREAKATAQLNSYPEMRHDWAFITQPGHIPARSRMIASDDRAYESLRTAKRMRDKAQGLRKVRVKGDAAAVRQAKRDAIRDKLKKGMKVDTVIYGIGTIVKVNKVTATVLTGVSEQWKTKVDLSFLRIVTWT